MNMVLITVSVVVVAFIAFLVFTPYGKQLMVKARGRADVISEQDASTAEGARDYLAAAIREKEEHCNELSELYSVTCGSLEVTRNELHAERKELAKVVQSLNRCIDENRDDDAMIYATKKQKIEKNVEILKNDIKEMEEMTKQQKELLDHSIMELDELKAEKETIIRQMQSDDRMTEMRNRMNSVVPNNETDRMLEMVREGARKSRERAEGSRIAFESSAQTIERRLELDEQNNEARRMVEELKRQRGKA